MHLPMICDRYELRDDMVPWGGPIPRRDRGGVELRRACRSPRPEPPLAPMRVGWTVRAGRSVAAEGVTPMKRKYIADLTAGEIEEAS